MGGVRPYSGPSVPTTAATDTPIVAGGNLAASIAHGFFSAVAVGTATEVCGAEVLAFGHPIMDVPQGDLTMHGADVLYVQPDSLGQPYKVANVGGPVGWIPDNLLPGLHGSLGAAPPATQVESTSTVGDGEPVTGTTFISLRPFVPTYTAFAAVAVEDRALGVNMNSWFGMPGSDLVTWTVEGTRADGFPLGWTRTERFAKLHRHRLRVTLGLHDQINQLLNNESETVTVTRVTTTSSTKPVYEHLRIASLEVRAAGAWQPVGPRQTVEVVADSTQRFRITDAHRRPRHAAPGGAVPRAGRGGRCLRLPGRRGRGRRLQLPLPTVPRWTSCSTCSPTPLATTRSWQRLAFPGAHPARLRVLRGATVGGSAGVTVHVLE